MLLRAAQLRWHALPQAAGGCALRKHAATTLKLTGQAAILPVCGAQNCSWRAGCPQDRAHAGCWAVEAAVLACGVEFCRNAYNISFTRLGRWWSAEKCPNRMAKQRLPDCFKIGLARRLLGQGRWDVGVVSSYARVESREVQDCKYYRLGGFVDRR